MRTLVLLLALLPGTAFAQYRFEAPPELDHRDQWGLEAAPGVSWGSSTADRTLRLAPALDLRLSRAVTHQGEVAAGVRLLSQDDRTGVRLDAGWRTYFGLEAFKTFADAGVLVAVHPQWAVGGRVAVGAMWDLSRHLGLLVRGGGWAAGGPDGALLGFELHGGLQLRI